MKKLTKKPRQILIPLESQEAVTLVQWARLHPIAKYHLIRIANERKCGWQYGKKLKAEGLTAGILDYFLAYPSKDYHGLFLELKRIKYGKLSVEQELFIAQRQQAGYHAIVAYGANEAIKAIEDYLR